MRIETVMVGPLLSAIVVQRESGRPGTGFYTLARNLGLLVGQGHFPEEAFHVAEVQRVFDYWHAHQATP